MPLEADRSISSWVKLAILLAVAALAVLAGIAWFTGGRENEVQTGVVRVDPVPTPTPAAIAAPPPPSPMPSAPMMPGPTPGPKIEMQVSPEVLTALDLPKTAVFRETRLNDSDDGVICGEVARSAAHGRFRRFVYIAGSKAGFIDDGGPVFRQISAASCGTARP